jgi:hypothetical protein
LRREGSMGCIAEPRNEPIRTDLEKRGNRTRDHARHRPRGVLSFTYYTGLTKIPGGIRGINILDARQARGALKRKTEPHRLTGTYTDGGETS